jgi:hypothetical protein
MYLRTSCVRFFCLGFGGIRILKMWHFSDFCKRGKFLKQMEINDLFF